jgi:hypothetical protein
MLCVGLGLFRRLLVSSDLNVSEAQLSDEFDQDADADEDVKTVKFLIGAPVMTRCGSAILDVVRVATAE